MIVNRLHDHNFRIPWSIRAIPLLTLSGPSRPRSLVYAQRRGSQGVTAPPLYHLTKLLLPLRITAPADPGTEDRSSNRPSVRYSKRFTSPSPNVRAIGLCGAPDAFSGGRDTNVTHKGRCLMRKIALAALAAIAMGLIGTASVMAAPAQGNAIGAAAATTLPVTKAAVCATRRVCNRRGCAMRRVCR